jgi:hypothetical protein
VQAEKLGGRAIESVDELFAVRVLELKSCTVWPAESEVSKV